MIELPKGHPYRETNLQDGDVETIQSSPTFVWTDDVAEFEHSAISYRVRDKFFHGVVHYDTMCKKPPLRELVEVREIPLEIFPEYDSQLFGPVIKRLAADEYAKQPSLTGFRNVSEDRRKELMLAEAAVYQALRKAPHGHLICSHGCVVNNGHVTSFVLPRLKETLSERVQREGNPTPIVKDSWMSTMRSAVQHLHDLGFTHNDLNPRNIMFDDHDKLFIIDFDACMPMGKKLIKIGTMNWNDGYSKESCKENDVSGLAMIERFLSEEHD